MADDAWIEPSSEYLARMQEYNDRLSRAKTVTAEAEALGVPVNVHWGFLVKPICRENSVECVVVLEKKRGFLFHRWDCVGAYKTVADANAYVRSLSAPPRGRTRRFKFCRVNSQGQVNSNRIEDQTTLYCTHRPPEERL